MSKRKAVGVHAHPHYKTGRRDPSRKPALKLSAIKDSRVRIAGPIAPTTVSNMGGVKYALDNNNRFGVCVPTGFDNFRRTITKLLTGTQVSADWDQIVAWYQEQNPKFDPNAKPDTNGEVPHDEGMDIQTFLEARVKAGDILAFASVETDSEAEVREAVYLFLGIILGVDLQVAQQDQTDASPPVWDYKRSGEWGGHCVMEPAFLAANDECISWNMVVQMTQKFLGAQRSEAWVVITQDHINNANFRSGISLSALESELNKLTGKTYNFQPTPVAPPEPTPTPAPTPAPVTPPSNDDVDDALWALASDWVEEHRHSGEASDVAKALKAWAVAKGYES